MRCTISKIYVGKELCMFQTDLLFIIRSLNTVYTAIGICCAYQHDKYLLLCVQCWNSWWWTSVRNMQSSIPK